MQVSTPPGPGIRIPISPPPLLTSLPLRFQKTAAHERRCRDLISVKRFPKKMQKSGVFLTHFEKSAIHFAAGRNAKGELLVREPRSVSSNPPLESPVLDMVPLRNRCRKSWSANAPSSGCGGFWERWVATVQRRPQVLRRMMRRDEQRFARRSQPLFAVFPSRRISFPVGSRAVPRAPGWQGQREQ